MNSRIRMKNTWVIVFDNVTFNNIKMVMATDAEEKRTNEPKILDLRNILLYNGGIDIQSYSRTIEWQIEWEKNLAQNNQLEHHHSLCETFNWQYDSDFFVTWTPQNKCVLWLIVAKIVLRNIFTIISIDRSFTIVWRWLFCMHNIYIWIILANWLSQCVI